jgi:hypothetical protein
VVAEVAEQSTDSPVASEPTVFISYRRDDTRTQVPGLAAFLADRFGERNVFWDVDTLRNETGRYDLHIERMLASCHAVLIVIGSQWLTVTDDRGHRRLDDPMDFHRQEIEIALRRDDVEVIPVLVDGARMPAAPRAGTPPRPRLAMVFRRSQSKEELPSELADLARYQAHEISYDRYGADVKKLIAKIERARARLEENERAARKAAEERERAARQAADEEQGQVEERVFISSAETVAQEGDFEKARMVAGLIKNPISKLKALEKIVRVAREKGATEEVEATRQALRDAADAIVDSGTAGELIVEDAWEAGAAAKLKAGEE